MNLEMVCTCKFEGVAEVEARRIRIFTRMGLTNPTDLTTAIVLSLAFDFECDAFLAADHWFGLSVDTPLVPEGIYIECDHPADGLAAIWEVLADKFPERVSVARDSERGVGITNTRLAECEALYIKKHEHYATHGNDYQNGCTDCALNMDLCVAAHVALDEAWGSDTLDLAIGAAYGE